MTASSPHWTEEAYDQLEQVLRARAGLVFQPLRKSAVVTAATRVMQRVGVERPETFVPLVRQDGAVFDDLMAEVTIGETYFFRERAHFALLRKTILPEFRERNGDARRFRAWSAGCSTGEEPYSLAIALREEGAPSLVVGTDVSRARLSAARRGEYRDWSFRGVPDAIVARYFERQDDDYRLDPVIRRDVEFRYLNLASDCYPDMSTGVYGMDLILCRNVLIYFDRETVAHVATSLMASLAENGWILLGATDPLLNDFVECEVVQTDSGLAYRHFRGARSRSLRSSPATPAAAPIVVPLPVPAPLAAPPAAGAIGHTESSTRPPEKKTEASSGIGPASTNRHAPVNAESADSAYKRRDYERAIALLGDGAVSVASATDAALHVRALANVGRLDEAGRVCAAALDRHRESAELHYLHALLLEQAGHASESARAAKRALYLDRTMIVAHLALGSALVDSGQPVAARRAFAAAERLLRTMPADATVAYTDGEPAGRLLEMTRMQSRLVRDGDAA